MLRQFSRNRTFLPDIPWTANGGCVRPCLLGICFSRNVIVNHSAHILGRRKSPSVGFKMILASVIEFVFRRCEQLTLEHLIEDWFVAAKINNELFNCIVRLTQNISKLMTIVSKSIEMVYWRSSWWPCQLIAQRPIVISESRSRQMASRSALLRPRFRSDLHSLTIEWPMCGIILDDSGKNSNRKCDELAGVFPFTLEYYHYIIWLLNTAGNTCNLFHSTHCVIVR